MAVGFWLMLSPTVFGTQGPIADSSHLVGALAVSFTVIATGEPARATRFLNLPLGAWVIAAPWVFGASTLVTINGALVGLVLILLSIPRGTIRDEYGNWWPRYII